MSYTFAGLPTQSVFVPTHRAGTLAEFKEIEWKCGQLTVYISVLRAFVGLSCNVQHLSVSAESFYHSSIYLRKRLNASWCLCYRTSWKGADSLQVTFCAGRLSLLNSLVDCSTTSATHQVRVGNEP